MHNATPVAQRDKQPTNRQLINNDMICHLPAIRQPSTSLCGSWRMISRSLQVPGSDSSPFTTR